MKWCVALLCLCSAVFAGESVFTLNGQTITGSDKILHVLSGEVEGLDNPHCLAFGTRRAEGIDMRFSVGQYISSVSFEKKVIVNAGLIPVLGVTLGFTSPDGAGANNLSFNCRIKY